MPAVSEHSGSPARDPLVLIGLATATIISFLVFGIASSDWVAWLAHPMRVERLGDIPADTTQGVRVLRIAAVFAAITWIAVPVAVSRMRRALPVPLPGTPESSRLTLVLLSGITVMAILLRVPRLLESLWYDEIAAFIATSIHGAGPSLGNYHALANHALHSALVGLSVQAFGEWDAELAIRLPAFLAGVACVPAMFALGRAVDDDRLGLLAAATIALMPVAILESAESRGYSMMILFTILATHQWLRIADGRRGAIAWYAMLVACGVWSHLVFACVPLGHAAQAAIRGLRHREDRPAALAWFAALVLGGATTLLLVAPLVPGILLNRSEFVALDGDEPSVFGIEGVHAIWQLGGSWTWWAAVPGIGLLLFGLTESWRWPRLRLASYAGLAGGLVCVVATVAGDSWLYARFTLFLVAPAALLIAAAMRGAGQFLRRREPAILAGVVLAVAWSVGLAVLPPKQPIRDGIDRLRAEVGTDSSAWSIGLGDDVAMFYTEGRGPRLVHAPNLGRDLDATALAVGPDAAIVLYPDLVATDVLDRLRNAGFREIARFEGWLDWGKGDVAVWGRAENRG